MLRGALFPKAPGVRPLRDRPSPKVGQLGPGRGAQSLPKSPQTMLEEGAVGRAGRKSVA